MNKVDGLSEPKEAFVGANGQFLVKPAVLTGEEVAELLSVTRWMVYELPGRSPGAP